MQDKVEQQQLKRLVLNYEQREEAEELKGVFHSTSKNYPNISYFHQRWRHKADLSRLDLRDSIHNLYTSTE